MSTISTPVSFGELIDKITILEIKAEQIRDPAKVANVRTELDLLGATWAAHPASKTDIGAERANGEGGRELHRRSPSVEGAPQIRGVAPSGCSAARGRLTGAPL